MQSLARGSRKFKQFDGADDAPVGRIDHAPESNCHEGYLDTKHNEFGYLDRAPSKFYRKGRSLDTCPNGKTEVNRNPFKSKQFKLITQCELLGVYPIPCLSFAEIKNKWLGRNNIRVRAGKLTFYRTDTTLEHITLVRARGLLNAVTEEKE